MRILYVVKNMRLSNGVSSYSMNYYRKLKNKVEKFDFLVVSDVGSPYYQEIIADGNQIFSLPSYKKELNKIPEFLDNLFKNNSYDIIHSHVVNSASLILYYAKKNRIPIRILHSHATKTGDRKWKEIRNKLFSSLSLAFSNHYFACSNLAGDYLFGKKKYTVINNAIDLKKYYFKPQIRENIRNKEICANKVIVGTVGRMTIQKNPFFIVDIVKEMKNRKMNFNFWWFGDGELEKKIKIYAQQNDVLEDIVFWGACENVHEYYSAMDVFILPSIYEGLPVVGIEAQVSGLPSVFSDTVTTEVAIVEGVEFLPIDEPVKWAERIESWSKFDRQKNIVSLKTKKYQIESQGEKLYKMYEKLVKDKG